MNLSYFPFQKNPELQAMLSEISVPPRITKGPNNATMNEGENISLTCDAEGPPKPTFTWDLVSKNVTFGKIIPNKNKLELVNVRSTGLYHFTVVCIASNKGGNKTAEATIDIFWWVLVLDKVSISRPKPLENNRNVCGGYINNTKTWLTSRPPIRFLSYMKQPNKNTLT